MCKESASRWSGNLFDNGSIGWELKQIMTHRSQLVDIPKRRSDQKILLFKKKQNKTNNGGQPSYIVEQIRFSLKKIVLFLISGYWTSTSLINDWTDTQTPLSQGRKDKPSNKENTS